MNPGVTTPPLASTSGSPSGRRSGPTSAMRPDRTRTSARRAVAPVPSTTSPPRMSRLSSATVTSAPLEHGGALLEEGLRALARVLGAHDRAAVALFDLERLRLGHRLRLAQRRDEGLHRQRPV